MSGEGLKMRIEYLQEELMQEQQKYLNGIKAHKDYITLRSIREKIKEIKVELETVHLQLDQH
jgi:hypothetical protein